MREMAKRIKTATKSVRRVIRRKSSTGGDVIRQWCGWVGLTASAAAAKRRFSSASLSSIPSRLASLSPPAPRTQTIAREKSKPIHGLGKMFGERAKKHGGVGNEPAKGMHMDREQMAAVLTGGGFARQRCAPQPPTIRP